MSPDTALNGAQVTALVGVIQQVVMGLLPRESAVAIITTAFPVDKPTAETILGSVGRTFKPEPVEGAAPMKTPSATTISADMLDKIENIILDHISVCDDGDGYSDVMVDDVAGLVEKIRRDPDVSWAPKGSRGSMSVQSVLIPADWDEVRARTWLKEHDYHSSALVKEGEHWRARQAQPSAFEERSFRTKELEGGIKLVLGRVK